MDGGGDIAQYDDLLQVVIMTPFNPNRTLHFKIQNMHQRNLLRNLIPIDSSNGPFSSVLKSHFAILHTYCKALAASLTSEKSNSTIPLVFVKHEMLKLLSEKRSTIATLMLRKKNTQGHR